MKFRKKPVVVEAMQWQGDNTREIRQWMLDCLRGIGADPELHKHPFLPEELMLFAPRRSTHMTEELWKNIADPTWGKDISAAVYDYLHETWVGLKYEQWIIFGTEGEFYPCANDGNAPINYEKV